LEEIENEWDIIRKESPNFPIRVWKKIEKEMTLEKKMADYPDFTENA
jgi:hypothetical protein